jgi:clan AA aspartic protease
MALTHLRVAVSNPGDPKKKERVEFLIDSGAVYSVVPCKILTRLGIKPEEEREFTLANGQTIKRSLGIARFEYNKHRGGAPVIFGEKGDSALLGATTLEAMGMALDPLKRQLTPLPMVLG